MSNIINSFRGEYFFLSNMYPCTVYFEGEMYNSVEHAYVGAKTTDPEIRRLVRSIIKPGDAKRFGRGKDFPYDITFDDRKQDTMERLVRSKFTNSDKLKSLLLKTGDAELIEGNHWGDKFWGVCDGEGFNYLGNILMTVRSEL